MKQADTYRPPYDLDEMLVCAQSRPQLCMEMMIAKSEILKEAERNKDIAQAYLNQVMRLFDENKELFATIQERRRQLWHDYKDGPDCPEKIVCMLSEIAKKLHGQTDFAASYDGVRYSYYSAYELLKKEYFGYKKGEDGEIYVRNILAPLERRFRFLYNVKVKYNDYQGQTSETDLYILTPKGIFCCEVKNKGNERYLFEITRDGQWSKCSADGRFIKVMDSPFQQNVRHCLATENLLERNGVSDYRVIPLVIIGNENVRIKNESYKEIIRPSEFYDLYNHLNYPEIYDSAYLENIERIMECERITEDNFFKCIVFDEEAAKKAYDEIADLLRKLSETLDSFDQSIRMRAERNRKISEEKAGKMFIIATVFSLIELFFAVVFLHYGILFLFGHIMTLPFSHPIKTLIGLILCDVIEYIFACSIKHGSSVVGRSIALALLKTVLFIHTFCSFGGMKGLFAILWWIFFPTFIISSIWYFFNR